MLDRPTARRTTRPWVAIVGALLGAHAAFFAAAVLAQSGLPIHVQLSYAYVFVVQSFERSLLLLGGQALYRDVPFEYPPLAALAVIVPRLASLAGDLESYTLAYAAQNVLAGLLTAALVIEAARRWSLVPVARAALLYAAGTALLSPILPFRFDLLPALATLAALFLALSGRAGLAGVAMAVGGGLKLYPLALVPLLALRWLVESRWRDLGRFGSGLVVTSVLIVAPFVALAPTDWSGFLGYHGERGLELESLPAGLIAFLHVTGFHDRAATVVAHNSYELRSDLAEPAIAALPIAAGILLVAVHLLAARRFRREIQDDGSVVPATVLRYALAVLLALLLTSRVLSPQFMAWLLPFAALLAPLPALLALAAFGLTTAVFPFGIEQLKALELGAVALLELRNIALVGLLAWLLASPAAPPRRVVAATARAALGMLRVPEGPVAGRR